MTRHRAAQLLVVLFGVGFLLVIVAALVNGTREGALSETYTEVILSAAALLVGAVGGYLSRSVDRDDDDAVRSQVGFGLAAILGIMTVLFGVTLVAGAVVPALGDQQLSGNAVNILTVLIGGTVGALGAYLGLNPAPGAHPPPDTRHEPPTG